MNVFKRVTLGLVEDYIRDSLDIVPVVSDTRKAWVG